MSVQAPGRTEQCQDRLVRPRPGTGQRRRCGGEPALPGPLARSDETLVDVAPSPLRPRLQAGGERVVSLLVVRPGVPVR
jgi:hypothetical protein